jgi:hypothetical protein
MYTQLNLFYHLLNTKQKEFVDYVRTRNPMMGDVMVFYFLQLHE